MTAISRFVHLFRDSPTYGRDRANLVSGLTIGTAGLLLNGAVLMLVLPLMLDADDVDFRMLTENVEFGQLLALILLGGATAFATLLIPLRLVTVFWGPRIGRYFDQIVLSGISPMRFVIGKALSQNLFLGLILFLLLPYLVLSLTLGGVDLEFFVAGLFLLWLYCMALALVMLWLSMYVNELLAVLLVVEGAVLFLILGCLPLPIQPFVVTPLPALLHPVYSSIPSLDSYMTTGFLPIFLATTGCLSAMIGVSLFAIYMGPLYGIIRDNSTFGEVVRAGDSKRKRWIRLRLTIQRASEIAFFCENRGDGLRRYEGLIRWGLGFGTLIFLSAVAYYIYGYSMWKLIPLWGPGTPRWWVYEFHAFYLVIHGFSILLACFLFSHGKNTTYQRIPFCFGKMVEVSRLDTICFLLFWMLSVAASIATPFYFEQWIASPGGYTVFPDISMAAQRQSPDFLRLAVEANVVIAVAGLVVYSLHRLVNLLVWDSIVSLMTVSGFYFMVVCILPLFLTALFLELLDLDDVEVIQDLFPRFAIVSPMTMMMLLFDEIGNMFPADIVTFPFYVLHGTLIVLALFAIRFRGRKLRTLYLQEPDSEGS